MWISKAQGRITQEKDRERKREREREREGSDDQFYITFRVRHILNLLLHGFLVHTNLIHSTSLFTHSLARKTSLDRS